jgi:hypothetical protein
MGCLYRSLAQLALEGAQPTRDLSPPSPFTAGSLLVKSGRLATACRTGSCQGGSLVHVELMGGGWAEGGSPRRAVDGGTGWRTGNTGGERGHAVSGDEDQTVEDHRP